MVHRPEIKEYVQCNNIIIIIRVKCDSKSYCTRRNRVQIIEIIAQGEAECDYLIYCTRRSREFNIFWYTFYANVNTYSH